MKHWKRGTTIYRELRARGHPQQAAATVADNGQRWWKNSAKLINVAFSRGHAKPRKHACKKRGGQ
jgi:hypothetical protein